MLIDKNRKDKLAQILGLRLAFQASSQLMLNVRTQLDPQQLILGCSGLLEPAAVDPN
jgi:hypothetical protein